MKIDKPIYAPSGKYKLALNDKGDITFINTVPSDKVDIVYTEPLTEYLAPEAFVSQNGVQALVDPETGEYTFTPQSVAIVNEEHHRPLNPYTRYMLQKGVAPKDNEVEHLMERHRADLAGERADLTPFFANLMTGGYAEAAKQGWEDIKNKKYFSGGTEILSPLMFGENYWNNLALGLYGGVHLLNDNGIPKTVGLIIGNRNDGITGNKITDIGLSLTGDLINGLLAYSGGNTGIIDGLAASENKWAKGYTIGKALKGDINSTILKQLNPYVEWNAPITIGRNTELPRITTENMAGKSADSWEAAYSRALNSGNTEEAQRLIDLRWNNDAPNTKYNGDLYHNTTERFTAFDPAFMGKTDAGYYGHGFYFTPNKTDLNNALGPIQKHVYVNLENPRNLTASDYVSGELLGNDGAIVRNGEEGWLNLDGAPAPDPNEVMEVVVNKPENIKSVAPVTYDNNGWTIPITERFHFNPQDVDIRGRGWFGEPILTSPIIKTVQPNGKIRLSLPSHTESKPRQFVLEPSPEGNNKYYVHMRVWDDPKNKVPGTITDTEKQQLFEALYNELPEGAEILFPKSSPEVPGTRGTVAGLIRLSRDPRFIPGNPGVLYYSDKNGIKTFNGTSFIKDSKSSRIRDIRGIEGNQVGDEINISTEENAAFITPEQWNAAYRAAYERGDRAEGQRLWDLWFKMKAPDTQIVDAEGNPIHAYHGTGVKFNEFDTTGKYSTLDEGYYGVGAYFAPNKELAQMYADIEKNPVVYDTYLNIKNPLRHVRDENADLYGKTIVGNDGVISKLPDDLVDESFDMTEYVATKPNQIKSAEPFTLDDEGNLIDLTKRGNFEINDIRYFHNQSQYPNVVLRGKVPTGDHNPLDVRLQRMMLRSKLKQENPEIYNLIYDENNPFILPDLSISIVPKVRYDNIRKAMLDIDPSLSDVDLDMGIQIALANKKGVHFDLGNKSGDTIGGVNIVEIADAINMVRKLHGREAIPYDISMIAGHELGHGVQLSDDALRAVSGYYDPYEFYTQAGQVLDNAGIINNTLSPLSFNKFINLTNNYLANGNLDNGITKMRDFLMSLSPLERLNVMKNINRFSAGLFGAYLIGKRNNRNKNEEIS